MSQGKAVQQIHLLSSKSQLNELCHALLRLYRRFCQETSCFCWGKEWRGAGKGALREFSWCQGRMSIFAFLKKRKENMCSSSQRVQECITVSKENRSVKKILMWIGFVSCSLNWTADTGWRRWHGSTVSGYMMLASGYMVLASRHMTVLTQTQSCYHHSQHKLFQPLQYLLAHVCGLEFPQHSQSFADLVFRWSIYTVSIQCVLILLARSWHVC